MSVSVCLSVSVCVCVFVCVCVCPQLYLGNYTSDLQQFFGVLSMAWFGPVLAA